VAISCLNDKNYLVADVGVGSSGDENFCGCKIAELCGNMKRTLVAVI